MPGSPRRPGLRRIGGLILLLLLPACPSTGGLTGGSPDAGTDATVAPGDSSAVVDSAGRDGGAGDSASGACAPKTCNQLGTATDGGIGAACGTQDDGCGQAISCGTACAPGTLCVNGSCTCVGKTCPQLGATCGNQADGCGNFLNCGSCGAGSVCVTNVNGSAACGCKPQGCADLGLDCGMAPDGCGGVLNCGSCEAGSFCGGARADGGPGTQNVCGDVSCSPRTSCSAGLNCGTVSDGCGGVISCGSDAGTCPVRQTCGGGTSPSPNVCGCTPQTCAQQGKNCGPSSDGCGQALTCGTCTAPEVCSSSYQCVCIPTCTNGCGGADGCGGMCPVTCGGCCTGGVGGACSGGISNSACGRNGASCAVCDGVEMCMSGECVIESGSGSGSGSGS